MRFLVAWEIDIDADSPESAARRALEIQRDPESTAVVFDVMPIDEAGVDPSKAQTVRIDLMETGPEEDSIPEDEDPYRLVKKSMHGEV